MFARAIDELQLTESEPLPQWPTPVSGIDAWRPVVEVRGARAMSQIADRLAMQQSEGRPGSRREFGGKTGRLQLCHTPRTWPQFEDQRLRVAVKDMERRRKIPARSAAIRQQPIDRRFALHHAQRFAPLAPAVA